MKIVEMMYRDRAIRACEIWIEEKSVRYGHAYLGGNNNPRQVINALNFVETMNIIFYNPFEIDDRSAAEMIEWDVIETFERNRNA